MSAFSFPPGLLPVLSGVSTGAVAVTWLAALLLRRKSAALRHFLWLLALCVPLFALPLVWMHVRIAIPILPPAPGHEWTPGSVSKNETVPGPDGSSPANRVSTKSSAASAAMPAVRREFVMPCNPWIAAWLLGAGVIVARILASQLRVGGLLRRGCSPGAGDLVQRLDRTKEQFGFVREVRVMVTPLTEIPFCHGVFQPTVIFPESWQEWDEERIEVCLTHELAHIIRGDLLAMLAGQVTCVLCWFNPLVWFAATRLRDEAEKSADDLVLAKNIRPETYAANLVAITEKCRSSALSPTIALSMARPNRLKTRVEAILNSNLRREAPGLMTMLSIGLVAIGALAGVMVVRLTAAPAPTAAQGQNRDLANLDPRKGEEMWDTINSAIRQGDIDAVDAFLKRGLDVNANLVSNCTLLYLAVDDNQAGIVKLLLSKGADLNRKTSWGDTPVKRACWRGYKDIADLLIKAGAQKDELLYATGMGDVEGLDVRDKKQAITAKEARGAINFAVASGHENTFDWLWAKLGPLDDKQKEKLLGDLYESAGKWGQPGILQRLEKLGASPAQFGSRALVTAVCWNFPDTVKYLLNEGVSANVVPPHWGSMLRDSAGEGHIEIVRLLLDHGADMNVRDTQGFTPLAWAAYMGKENVCLLLLERGADGNIEDDRGLNAAWHAAGGAHCPAALEIMIKKGVKVTGQNKQGMTILQAMGLFVAPSPGKSGFPGKIYSESEMQAYNVREHRTIDILAAAPGIDISGTDGSESPLMSAIQNAHYEAALALIDNGANLNIKDGKGNKALSYLFTWSRDSVFPLNVLEAFLKRGGDPNEESALVGVTPRKTTSILEKAVLSSRLNGSEQTQSFQKAVQALLDHGGKFPGTKSEMEQALLVAAARGDLKKMQDTVAAGASVNATEASGLTPLIVATALGYFDETRWLLDHGADAGKSAEDGQSPLFAAVISEQADLVDLLISKMAKPIQGATGLDYAVRYGNQRIFDALLKAGADPAQASLYSCIDKGRVEMARTLLDRGVNPQPPAMGENRGNVYWAVCFGQTEILKMLLDHGADPTWVDSYGETPLKAAQKYHKEMVPMLEAGIKRWQAGKLREANVFLDGLLH